MRSLFRRKLIQHSPLEGYDLWAKSYSNEKNPIKSFSDAFVNNSKPSLNGKKVLDVGCGPGIFCAQAEIEGASEIVGIDLSPEMILVAKSKCQRVRFIEGSILNAQPGNGFDVLVCSLVLGHLENLTRALDKLIEALGNGGILILTDFHPYQTLTNARRTFKDDKNNTHEVIHYLHHISEYFSGLKESASIETFEEFFYNEMPVVFGMTARKKGD